MKNIERLLAKKVKEVGTSPKWFKSSFHQQVKFITDPAPMKAAQCTRRAGKSYGCGLYLAKEAYENPGVSVLYLATTRVQAKKIMWKDVLHQIDRDFKLRMKFNEQELTATLPNGSIIYLDGADSSYQAAERIRGQKIKLAILDEAASFKHDVENIVNKILLPTLVDYEGTLALIGTTNDMINSYFARVTRGIYSGYSIHKWMSDQNPHTRRQVRAQVRKLKEADPEVEAKPWFRQEYLNEWVVDSQSLVYKYQADRTLCSELPLELNKFTYSLGVTLSYSGHTAVSVVAYSDESPDAFVVECESYQDDNLYRAIETIQTYYNKYDLSYITCAEASDTLLKEIQTRFSVPVEAAPEKDKAALIRLFAAELDTGRIKVLEQNKNLLSEWDSIILDNRLGAKAQLREHPACANHIATATLYAWHTCYNYLYSPQSQSNDPMDPYWEKLQDEIKEPLVDEFDTFY